MGTASDVVRLLYVILLGTLAVLLSTSLYPFLILRVQITQNGNI